MRWRDQRTDEIGRENGPEKMTRKVAIGNQGKLSIQQTAGRALAGNPEWPDAPRAEKPRAWLGQKGPLLRKSVIQMAYRGSSLQPYEIRTLGMARERNGKGGDLKRRGA